MLLNRAAAAAATKQRCKLLMPPIQARPARRERKKESRAGRKKEK
jgi:hypothetical protein